MVVCVHGSMHDMVVCMHGSITVLVAILVGIKFGNLPPNWAFKNIGGI